MPITIRHAQAGDAPAFQKIYEGPLAYSGTLQLPYPSLANWEKRLAEPPEGMYHLVACADTEVVGSVGIHTFPKRPRRQHAAEVGMGVRDDWQGKGVGSALLEAAISLADGWLQLTRLELEVFVENEAGRRLYKKFGFVEEGLLRKFAFQNGVYVDAVAMARLKP